ncbi:MAG TPA: bifunctional diaminohydroxyphosphoribosylaminopyrimidine deaminase/5-amino-6-(5-phosphoribosylamino)uracil reductase RibD [Bacteroidales bacterium]|nr:bifunctional diaminohydroxyphosphoribosylaminopyrimidine deaminase/5-amino-6-(5-phosphoribosylamino)uracil reductase RibD [Bacteroidales bacterium]
MEENYDDKFMRRCIDLASCAGGMTYPNPLVGSVVVHDGIIIGEGYHLKAGMPHAEVNAINSVRRKALLPSSSLYVNLEPCSHFGKTPPCADFIISHSIPKVIIGTTDTSRKVNGEGARKLKSAGIEVVTGIMENESRWLNRRFFTWHELKRPLIILKWAQSEDGFIDFIRKEDAPPGPNWISGKPERVLVHRWRSIEQSILAGAGTMRTDNPALNVRFWSGSDPLKLILSSSGKVKAPASEGRFIVFTHNHERQIPGAEIVVLERSRPSCMQVADYLYSQGIQSVIVEGGAEVLNHFIANNLWDEARIFTGNACFKKGIPAPGISGKLISEQHFAGSNLQVYLNQSVKHLQFK